MSPYRILRSSSHARNIALFWDRMFAEPSVQHHRPHFHAYYQDAVGIFAIDSIEVLGGDLPQRQRRFIEAWAEIHQADLLQDWKRLQAGRPPFKIESLR